MNLETLCKNAAAVKYEMQVLSTEKKNQVLEQCAQALVQWGGDILKANGLDMERAVEKGMPQGLQDRQNRGHGGRTQADRGAS